MGLSEFDVCGEFAAIGAPLPVVRGELVDVLISADTMYGPVAIVNRAIVAWCERDDNLTARPTADTISFDTGLAGLLVSMPDLLTSEEADGIVTLRLPHGLVVWLRLLFAEV
jgi:hypothetical protein